ncbi:AAA family ATPase [Massilia sp. B-10]|nr:AAA family ATPase [Massilia sp. B-10]
MRESAIKSDIFVFSLIRSEGGYNAFHHGFEALLGISWEKISLAPVKLELPLSGFSGFSSSVPLVFEFSHEGLFPQRISVLIGKNGVGKSRMLNHICERYLDQFCYHFLPKVSRLIAIRTPGETEYTFPRKPENSQVDYLKLSTSFKDDSPIEDSLPETLYRLSRSHWSSDELERPRWTLFKRAISNVLPVSALVIAAAELGAESPTSRTVALEDLTASSEHVRLEARRALEASGVILMSQDDRLVPLSSGQLSFLRLAAQLSYNVVGGSLVLIDEPETHLHPQLISQFMAMLDSILSATDSVAIVATHSPYVVREVPAEQVKIVYRESSGAINVMKPRLKTLGADVGSISASIFADELVIENVKKIANEIRVNPEKYTDWETMLKAELSSEAVLHIRQFLHGESKFTK